MTVQVARNRVQPIVYRENVIGHQIKLVETMRTLTLRMLRVNRVLSRFTPFVTIRRLYTMIAVAVPAIFRNQYVQHGLFWLFGALALRISLSQAYAPGVYPPLADMLTRIGIHLIGFSTVVYFNLRVLIPRLFSAKRYVFYFISVLVSTLGAAYLVFTLYRFIIAGILPLDVMMRGISPRILVIFFIQATIFVIASSLLHFVKRWTVLKSQALEAAELERKKLEAELLALRAQLNPHFLFNALNNLYALSLDASPETPDTILKLSSLMRYILYESQTDHVSLEKEVQFVQNYLDLEKLRVADDVDIQFKLVGRVNGQQVAPLMFMPLVENAFKHGLGSHKDGGFVHILLHCDTEDEVVFRIENSKEAALVPADNPYSGVGLTNIKRRLALRYPDQHNLDIQDRDDFFRVQLTLPTL